MQSTEPIDASLNPEMGLVPINDRFAHPLPIGSQNLPTGLAEVVDAWPNLPEALKTGILAMIRAASGDGGGR